MGQRQYKKSAAKGKCAENAFDIAASKFGWIKSREATRDENRLEHWDKLYWIDGVETKIEVKSSKRFSRFKKVQFDFVLLELHGVDHPSNKGWLYGSTADLIGFELLEKFLIFRRIDLIEFVFQKTGIKSADDQILWESRILSPTYKKSENYNNLQPYQIYYRLNSDGNDNLDSFIWVPLVDLTTLENLQLNKV